MSAVTVSPKFQIVIPKSVRKRLGIKAGEKLQVISFDNRIELIRMPSADSMRGILKAFDSSFERDENDRI